MVNKQYEQRVNQFESDLGRYLDKQEKDFIYWMCEQEQKTYIS